MNIRYYLLSVLLLLAIPLFADPKSDVRELNTAIDSALKQLPVNRDAARADFQRFRDGWFSIEAGVKGVSKPAYGDIETAMSEVRATFEEESLADIQTALKRLRDVNQTFASGGYSTSETPQHKGTVEDLLIDLAAMDQAIQKGDLELARTTFAEFQSQWLEVEGLVASKSGAAYSSIESEMGVLSAALRKGNIKAAQESIARLQNQIKPFQNSRYTMFDVSIILIREGFEALLVILFLFAYLKKNGETHRQKWLWIGAIQGIILSVALAFVLHFFFATVQTGTRRELIEGVTGLFAASILFYVSYWLHSKASIERWQSYVSGQMSTALKKGGTLSLAFLSFLCVFREGAETILFYLGVAPFLTAGELISGILIGAVVLTVLGTLVFVVGLRIPLRPFFFIASGLIYYLGFRFIGSGVRALQVSGYLPSTPAPIPALESFGLYPTWESFTPQLLVIVIAVALLIYSKRKSVSAEPQGV
ncbi:MAG: FTR1 family iron permease [Spirochaetia bacterium]|nr:FTR1 family iron permease [Spirochaetia bacterium]